MRTRRVGSGAPPPIVTPGDAAKFHRPEVCNRQTSFLLFKRGSLGQQVPEAVEPVVDLAVVAQSASWSVEGILGSRQPVEIVVLEELAVAARVAGGHQGCRPEIRDTAQVGGQVEIVLKSQEGAVWQLRRRGDERLQTQARVVTASGAHPVAEVHLSLLV